MAETWLKCTACRNPISYGATHQVCSVSTCNRKGSNFVFCTVSCWDSHVADARHRDAWAVEKRAPSKDQWAKEQAESPAPAPTPAPVPVVQRRVVVGEASAPAASSSGGPQLADTEREVLIVVSKMKKYIKDRSGFNCSDAVADMLSDHVRAVCDDAIRAAARDERKTVLDRDVPRPLRR